MQSCLLIDCTSFLVYTLYNIQSVITSFVHLVVIKSAMDFFQHSDFPRLLVRRALFEQQTTEDQYVSFVWIIHVQFILMYKGYNYTSFNPQNLRNITKKFQKL